MLSLLPCAGLGARRALVRAFGEFAPCADLPLKFAEFGQIGNASFPLVRPVRLFTTIRSKIHLSGKFAQGRWEVSEVRSVR